MATRSTISAKMTTGEYKVIYCHFDGYLSGVGKLLLNGYTSQEDVESLIGLGDISSLGENVSLCDAYHRDRGEEFSISNRHSCPLETGLGRLRQEYNYYWDGNEWHVSGRCSCQWVKLSEIFNSGEE